MWGFYLGKGIAAGTAARFDAVRKSRLSPRDSLHSSLSLFDYIGLLSLLVLLFPAFRFAHLPLRSDFINMATAYWGGTALHALFVFIGLTIIGLPPEQTILPFLRRYHRQKLRVLIVIIFEIWMTYTAGITLGSIIVIDGLAFAELLERKRTHFKELLLDIFIPALYLFFGLILVFALNHAIARMRFAGTYDTAFVRLDQILFHVSVAGVARWGLGHIPQMLYNLIEFAYYSLYRQIGAVLLFIAIYRGRTYAIRYIRTLLIGYSLALFIFLVVPTIGPFDIYPLPLHGYSHAWSTSWTQMTILDKARSLWAHKLSPAVLPVNIVDYYIGFPCMHIALPCIALWFLRPWRRIAWLLALFDFAVLAPSIILLEWHYLVDLFGGFIVALLAIWLSERISRENVTSPTEYPPDPSLRLGPTSKAASTS